MIPYPEIDPVAFSVGPLKVHWYGIMYLFAFISAWWLGVRRTAQAWSPLKAKQVEDLGFYCAMGVVLGGRCGYVFFYGFDTFLGDPLWLFRVWEGGMSFHGGLLGVIVAMVLYARKVGRSLLSIGDFVAPLVPSGLFFGRMGNFIGGELWGRASDVPWAMVFPNDPQQLARHPSQLYEAALEGIVMFLLLFWFSRKRRPAGAVAGLFLILYGIFRFSIEFFREPDAHIQFDLFNWVTRGQMLSAPMILIGLSMVAWGYYQQEYQQKR